MFHAHCLAGRHYADDLFAMGNFSLIELPSFPLERLHALISKKIWSDPESEKFRTETLSCPYQLWREHPSKNANCTLQNIIARCPSCKVLVELEFHSFKDKGHTKCKDYECTSCRSSFTPSKMIYFLPGDDSLGYRYS